MWHANMNAITNLKACKYTVVLPLTNVNVNAANESVLLAIGANANAIELNKGFDIPFQIERKTDVPHLHSQLPATYHL